MDLGVIEMEKIIKGYSVDENLVTGMEYYGELGELISVIDYERNNIAVIKNHEGLFTARDTVIDVSASMSKSGPIVTEQIYVSSNERQLDDNIINAIRNGSLDSLGMSQVNIELGLEQSSNCVYVAEEELLDHLRNCKRIYPELPLDFAMRMMPFEKSSSKSL